MPKFQYVGQGSTNIVTEAGSRDKQKVVEGEIVEIAEGLYTDGRLMLAGFQKIAEGVQEVIEAAEAIAETIVEEITEEEPKDEEPTVEVTVEEDGTDEITVEVTEEEPKKTGKSRK